MSRNKKDVFKELISKAEPQIPADNMADMVTQQIIAITEDEVAITPALKRLLQQHATDGAPLAFTSNVMAQLNPKPAQIAYAPLIPKKAWYIVASVLSVLIFFSFWSSPAEQAPNSFADTIIKQVNGMPSVFIISLIFCALLLALDHLLTNRLKMNKL